MQGNGGRFAISISMPSKLMLNSMRVTVHAFKAVLLTALLLAIGCGPAGRVRVSEKELFGTYQTDFSNAPTGQIVGKEQIILHSDNTYEQIFSSSTRKFMNRGTWKSSNMFLDGTEIELNEAIVSEDAPSGTLVRHGDLYLQVHKENGHLKLARNEAFDWYYDRMQ